MRVLKTENVLWLLNKTAHVFHYCVKHSVVVVVVVVAATDD